jgi:hypothetical protein
VESRVLAQLREPTVFAALFSTFRYLES